MTVSKKVLNYILVVLGVAIFLAGYFLVYTDFVNKTDTLNAETQKLNSRLSTLSGYNANLQKYKTGIDQDKTDISQMLNKYYSAEKPEDFIMLAINIQNKVGPNVSGMTFTDPAATFEIAGVTDGKDANAPVKPVKLTSYMISSTINASMKYEQMKKTLDYIASQPDVTKLSHLSMTFDSATGLVNGSFVLDKYYITGRDIEEHQIVLPKVPFGKKALIGT